MVRQEEIVEEQQIAAAPQSMAVKMSAEEYAQQSAEYTAKMLADLNAKVKANPEIADKSTFFQCEENILKGLPVFQGEKTTFVYDDADALVETVVQQSVTVEPAVVESMDEEQHDDENDEEEQEEQEQDEEGAEEWTENANDDNEWAEGAEEDQGTVDVDDELAGAIGALAVNQHVRFSE
jgi:hypothetical protein